MATFKTGADLAANGTLTVVGLPFKSGEKVEVTIEPIEEAQKRRTDTRCEASPTNTTVPFVGVTLDDWGIQQDS